MSTRTPTNPATKTLTALTFAMTFAITVAMTFAIIVATFGAGSALADAAAGKEMFVKTNCNSCHGLTGMGDGPVAAALDPKPRNYTVGDFKFDANKDGKPGGDEDLALVIKNGAAPYGGSAMMMPNPTLSDADIALLIQYIRSLKK
jgi:mono/diheme cytochrome c family protein